MKRIFLLALATMFLAGCSRGLFQTPEPPIEITFNYPGSDESFYTPLLERYQEEHPTHTIISQPGQNGRNEQTDVLVVGLFEDPPGETPFRYLDEILAEDESLSKSDWHPGALDAFRKEGHIYAVPYGLDPIVLFYNQELFDSLGLSAPQPDWSWENFLALAEALTQPLGGSYGYAPVLGYDQDAMIFIYQFGGRLFDENSNPTLDDPATIAALEWYARMYTLHEVAYPYTINPENVYKAVAGGKVGMWMLPFSYRGSELDRNMGISFKTGLITFPASNQQTTVALFEGYAISSQAEDPRACWTFIRYLLDQPNPRLVPARRSLSESEIYQSLVGEEAARTGRQAVSRVLQISRAQLTAFARISPIFKSAVEQVLKGQMTADEALDQAQRLASGE